MKTKICGITALMLILCLLVPAFSGCADGTKTDDTQPPAASSGAETEAVTAEETTEEIDDRIGKYDFGESTYRILARKLTSYEYMTTEDEGNIVKSAVSKRNLDIEERFNVKIELIEEPGNWDNRDAFIKVVENAYAGGTDAYDLVSTHSAYAVNIGIKGFSYNLLDLPEVDLSAKWWCPMYTENVNIGGAVYTAVGDIGYTLYEYMMCVFYNKDLAETYHIDDLYGIAKRGEWTYDKMLELSRDVHADLNTSGVPDDGDLFGLAMSGHACRLSATAWDTKITVKDDTGKQVMNLPNDKYIEAYAKLYTSIWENPEQVVFKGEGASHDPEFVAGHILFFPEKLAEAAKMRDMTSDYGILPYPKYDSDQKEYISSARDAMNAVSVMRNISDKEKTGAVTEALCMYGRKYVTPAYYETTLKYRYLNDPDAVYMLDLIRDTMTFDFAMTFTNSLGLVYSIMGDNISNKVKDISSTLRSAGKSNARKLDDIYSAYEKIK